MLGWEILTSRVYRKRRKKTMPFIGIISEENIENCVRKRILESKKKVLKTSKI